MQLILKNFLKRSYYHLKLHTAESCTSFGGAPAGPQCALTLLWNQQRFYMLHYSAIRNY
jgi:hypothetical protein